MADETRTSEGEQPERRFDPPPAGIQTFLIADVRGYTLFTHERGDEAAAKLAARFASIARAEVETRGGAVIELRGDEALAVFSSARQAIRAAVDLQQRFVEETAADPTLPLPVGIGLDAGEAVPVEEGYRGGALNLAARLCGQAKPGEILASQEVVHLARKVEGLTYVDRGAVSFKGLADPIHVIAVVPNENDPVKRFAALLPKPEPRPVPVPAKSARQRTVRRALILALGLAVIAAVVIVPIATHHGSKTTAGLSAVPANAVGIIDPGTNRITGQVALGDIPTGITAGAGAAWVTLTEANTVARIDPATSRVEQRIGVGAGPTGIAYGAGAVWVADGDARSVSRINPTSNTVVQTIAVGNAPRAIAFGERFVWVTNALDGTVTKIDPNSGTVRGTFAAEADPVGVAVGGGSVWVSNGAAGTVDRIDPAAGTIRQRIAVGNGPAGMAFDGRSIWVANSQDGTVSRLEATTGAVSTTVKVGSFPNQVAASSTTVWVANTGSAAVTRIDARSGTVMDIARVASAPQALAIVEGKLWVTARGSAASHQGGTLVVLSNNAPLSIDPNAAYDPTAYTMLTSTNDGLLTFARVGGAAGGGIVPDLATAVPKPVDDGRTYTFYLRRGIHYSDGSLVRPQDVRHSFARFLTIATGPTNGLAHVIGASDCKPQGKCDLSQGIVSDDATWSVTFHLSAPDPTFLDIVALPVLAIVPSSAPAKDIGTDPLPATGPYMIESYVSEQQAVLVRNPRFRQWSPSAQPTGYPQRIVFRYGVDLQKATTDVEQGRADLILDEPPADRLEEVRTRFAAQSHPHTGLGIDFMFLNTRVPPFENVDARRAINFAVDRNKMASLVVSGGVGAGGAATCQALPPNFPGYAPYCPYTVSPNAAGTWTAPDLDQARSLVAASGTKGQHVTVWTFERFDAVSRYVEGVLRDLGYRVSEQEFDANHFIDYFDAISDSTTRAQIGPYGWFIDTPTPQDIIGLFSCATFVPNNNANTNAAEFCDPKIEREIRQAQALQTSNPPLANTLWARIDREITDQAPVVAFTNPSGIFLNSSRAGNFQYNPVIGILVDQLWVT